MIRIARRADLRAIVAIYNEAVADRFATADLDPVTEESRAAWFRSHDPRTHPIFVAEPGGAVAGWCSLTAYRGGRGAVQRTAEISYYVARAARRQGVGRALVEHALRTAPALGIHVLFGIILERNAGSVGLMERCGFSCWGRLPDVAQIEGELVAHLYYGRAVDRGKAGELEGVRVDQ
jgi:L-amino acid N-acyltransferase YncA